MFENRQKYFFSFFSFSGRTYLFGKWSFLSNFQPQFHGFPYFLFLSKSMLFHELATKLVRRKKKFPYCFLIHQTNCIFMMILFTSGFPFKIALTIFFEINSYTFKRFPSYTKRRLKTSIHWDIAHNRVIKHELNRHQPFEMVWLDWRKNNPLHRRENTFSKITKGLNLWKEEPFAIKLKRPWTFWRKIIKKVSFYFVKIQTLLQKPKIQYILWKNEMRLFL